MTINDRLHITMASNECTVHTLKYVCTLFPLRAWFFMFFCVRFSFCFCFGYMIHSLWVDITHLDIYPHSSGLPHWYWAALPLKQPWTTWVNWPISKHNEVQTKSICMFWVMYCDLTHCGLVMPYSKKDGSANGFLPDGTKQLPKPMLTCHHWCPLTLILGQCLLQYSRYQYPKNCVWNLHISNHSIIS